MSELKAVGPERQTPIINQRLGGIMSVITDKENNLHRTMDLFRRISGKEPQVLAERPKWEENISGCLSAIVEYLNYLENQTSVYLHEIEEYI